MLSEGLHKRKNFRAAGVDFAWRASSVAGQFSVITGQDETPPPWLKAQEEGLLISRWLGVVCIIR